MSGHGETRFRDPCTACGVHKDLRLGGINCSDETKSGIITYSLEVPVNHVARMEVVETFSDTRQLTRE